ncbi:MAG: TetR/AcrR family transcriptional regulator [Actinobacteria bacterium]|nr:TetR/AcrR family transcriptional regulator [Actinomycetota bacterium]
MSEHVKPSRSYHSPLRAAQARETRRRVVAAARELFLKDGYPRTTIAAVAARADVAADTVLHLFGSKRGLLKETMDVTIGGDDQDVPFLERDEPQQMAREPDQRRQIAIFAACITRQLERIRPWDYILRRAAAVDTDAAALRASRQLVQRRAAMRFVAQAISAHGPLRAPEGAGEQGAVETAAAVLWTASSPEVHQMLRDHWGWTPEAYESWLRTTLESSLLP